MMKCLLLVVAVFAPACLAQIPGFGSCPGIQAQPELNVTRYLGEWYEIYAFPQIFEWGQKCISANYTLRADGHINVDNRGIRGGKAVQAIGDAYRPDTSTLGGQLLVRFGGGAAPYGDYWVIDTDYDTHTLIYSCGKVLGLAHVEQAWILSRTRTLPQATIDRLMAKMTAGGVDVGHFSKTDQTGC